MYICPATHFYTSFNINHIGIYDLISHAVHKYFQIATNEIVC
nr:MAG TPA: hypothetical protein [Caudoviricetes sp.]